MPNTESNLEMKVEATWRREQRGRDREPWRGWDDSEKTEKQEIKDENPWNHREKNMNWEKDGGKGGFSLFLQDKEEFRSQTLHEGKLFKRFIAVVV